MGLTHQKERGCERERRVFEGCVAGARDRQAGCEAKTRSAAAKRKNGEGSIHKLPNGRWRAQYYVETPKAASDVRSDQIQRMRDGSGLTK